MEEVEQASKRGRELRCRRLTKAIRERKREQHSLPHPLCTSHVWHGSVSPKPAQNRREFLGIPWISAVNLESPQAALFSRMPSVSLSLPSALAGRAKTWVCLSCMFWVRNHRQGCAQVPAISKRSTSSWEEIQIFRKATKSAAFWCRSKQIVFVKSKET